MRKTETVVRCDLCGDSMREDEPKTEVLVTVDRYYHEHGYDVLENPKIEVRKLDLCHTCRAIYANIREISEFYGPTSYEWRR